jgi:hypothetical protein
LREVRLGAFLLFLAAMTVISLGSGLLAGGTALVLCSFGAVLTVNRHSAALAAREAELQDVRVTVVRWSH